MTSITSANAVVTLTVPGLFNQPLQLQQFAADDIFGTDAIEIAETSMGVDGYLTGGFVNVPTKQTYSLQADSPSNFIFDQWALQQKAVRDTFVANGLIVLTSLGMKYTMTRGFLTQYQSVPDAKKLLQPRKYVITWQSGVPAPT
jgi:hypothetical protein